MIPLVTVEGPTASGKSALALALARELGTEIISADSRQIYRHLDIGTAKPPLRDRELVPHHLIDILEPSESYNLGRFIADAGRVIKDVAAQGKIPIVCGGTGLYVAGLLRGIFPQIEISPEVRIRLRERLVAEGRPALYAELQSLDPDFAKGISANDRQRILRGLEVFSATGIPLSEHWRRQESKREYEPLRLLIDPPRPVLYDRINRRIGSMLEDGLLAEISAALDLGFSPDSPGLSSLGYREFLPHLLSGEPLSACAALAAQHTRNYAKRQVTWYRKYKFDLALPSNECIISETAGLIRARFGN